MTNPILTESHSALASRGCRRLRTEGGVEWDISKTLRIGETASGTSRNRTWLLCLAPKRGIGYGTEIVEAHSSMAIRALGANRIEMRIDSENNASIRVAEKAGFHLEGKLVNERRLADGTLRTTHVYSL